MPAGVMHKKLGTLVATAAATSKQISAQTLTAGTFTGAANYWVHAIGGDLYVAFGEDCTDAAAAMGVIVQGAPQLIPVEFDPRVLEKDASAKFGVVVCS